MDIVYPLIKGYNDNLELRYSLRSLSNLKYDNIHIIGYKPDWIKGVNYIYAEDNNSIKVLNVINKLKIICEDESVSEDFILMNDDFYILEPTEIRYYNQGTIENHLKWRKKAGMDTSKYFECLRRTHIMFPKGLDYELHVPIIYNKTRLKELFAKYDFTAGHYLLRNMYCNHFQIESEYMEDVKTKDSDNMPELGTFLSNHDSQIVNDGFVAFMQGLFPNKSKYEA